MKLITAIHPDLLETLERYRAWVFQEAIQSSIHRRIEAGDDSRIRRIPDPQRACSAEALGKIDHKTHNGYPDAWYGLDLNYRTVQNDAAMYDSAFFEELRRMNAEMDAELQNKLGARYCALKAFYPVDGYIPWHNNWNVPGYVMIFTHSPTGKGFWRHIEPPGGKNLKPDAGAMVHIDDVPGWHCKAGYFGGRQELGKVVWHCAYTAEPRITLSYVIPDRSLWESMVQEAESP